MFHTLKGASQVLGKHCSRKLDNKTLRFSWKTGQKDWLTLEDEISSENNELLDNNDIYLFRQKKALAWFIFNIFTFVNSKESPIIVDIFINGSAQFDLQNHILQCKFLNINITSATFSSAFFAK